ncbi:lipopolysaccharide assembly protein LapB [Planococcus sp. NCCP-2050]|uniref:tetratricopeptide repeat protein n=1 Tax=Planococcus sp. NCCP-2050 TaxID=2944679 RepID=UPI0020424A25|nr:tetratricopeptide repeat protein [Planococcus sp. NCCP-2050]GKW47329.1 hypothetical protein NCCP2050_30210 [Planococcus sp. NCCP-2050]
MKFLGKALLLLILFTGISIGSYWLIFSQGLILGLFLAFILLIFCLAVVALSLYGLHIGQLAKLRLANRMEIASLLILTIYLSSAIGLFALANTLIEAKDLTKDFTAAEKTQTLASSFFNSTATQNVAGTIEKNGISYSYTNSTKDEIDKVDALLEQEKERIDKFFGNESTGELTIVFHDDFDTLSEASGIEDALGYYDYYTQEIHLVPDEYSWDITLLHEYSHHQSHVYSQEQMLSETRLPAWFEEGTAEYLAGESSDWYEMEEVEPIDFHLMDHNFTFHDTYTRNFDPYVQSLLAVESLADAYGEDQLKSFLAAKMPSEFYKMLEETTGMTLVEFQETFLDDLMAESKAESETYEAAYEALDNGDHEEAQALIDELSASASDEELARLAWMQTDLYLMQDQFDEAIAFMENRLETSGPKHRIDDLMTLAEFYMLMDPEKSLALIQQADEESVDEAYTYELEAYLEAYELIDSPSPQEGYLILLDEELIYNETINKKLAEKVENEFPQAS